MVTTTSHLAALIRTRDIRKQERDAAETITVYRVEHKDSHIGPYQHEGPNVDLVMRLHGPDADGPQPTAFQDIPGLQEWGADCTARHRPDLPSPHLHILLLGKWPEEPRFAFENLTHLARWFGDSFETLADAGYVVGEYTVDAPDFHRGRNQVVFWGPSAVRVRALAFSEAFPDAYR